MHQHVERRPRTIEGPSTNADGQRFVRREQRRARFAQLRLQGNRRAQGRALAGISGWRGAQLLRQPRAQLGQQRLAERR